MITYDPPIVITPPPYSDQSGKVTQPADIVLSELKVTYMDTPHNKVIQARIEGVPNIITLISGETYEQIGDWTQQQIEDGLKLLLGSEPAKYLRALFPKTMEEDPNGPGTVLSKMIKSLGIVMSDSCSCRRHAIEMNTQGNDWCEQNIDTVVGWLREEANRRGLPFVDMIGKLMVGRAIKKSRKLLANQPVPENDEDLDKE
jgi:hypothetical protein